MENPAHASSTGANLTRDRLPRDLRKTGTYLLANERPIFPSPLANELPVWAVAGLAPLWAPNAEKEPLQTLSAWQELATTCVSIPLLFLNQWHFWSFRLVLLFLYFCWQWLSHDRLCSGDKTKLLDPPPPTFFLSLKLVWKNFKMVPEDMKLRISRTHPPEHNT